MNRINENSLGTVFRLVGADIEGKYSPSRVMAILNGNHLKKLDKLVELAGNIILAVQNINIKIKHMVGETRISGQPHYVYMDHS